MRTIMGKKTAVAGLIIILGLGVALLAGWLVAHPPAVLSPRGLIAHQERNLMLVVTLLMLVVVVPVFILTFTIAWRYRAGNGATYQPDWDHHRGLEATWWAIPGLIILIIGVVTWRSSHQLDPYQPVAGARPLTIQVVALPWKWLFIYPEQHIATVNALQLPVGRPVNFEITADAAMNSFWIPQLGGQIYAMPGMTTQLHLRADQPGSYEGSSANLSGRGFAGMHFTAKAASEEQFERWVTAVKRSPARLSQLSYGRLAQPSADLPPQFFSAVDQSLYDGIVMKYMMPMPNMPEGGLLP